MNVLMNAKKASARGTMRRHLGLIAVLALLQLVLMRSSSFAPTGLCVLFLFSLVAYQPVFLAGGASVLLLSDLAQKILGPFLSEAVTLQEVVGVEWIFISAAQWLTVAHLLQILELGPRNAPCFRPLLFLSSVLAYGTGLLLIVESGFAAAQLAPVSAFAGVILHAFQAETVIHVAVLILWFGAAIRAICLYCDTVEERQRFGQRALRQQIEDISRLLPTLGFLGTVIGLAAAISALSGGNEGGTGFSTQALPSLFHSLAIKFETSLLGLLASFVMGLLLSLVDGAAAGREPA